MSKTEKVVSWVVYRMTTHGKPNRVNAVCQQDEWEAIERARPGYHTLILAGITSEGEAERLARKIPLDGDTSKPPKSQALPPRSASNPTAAGGEAGIPPPSSAGTRSHASPDVGETILGKLPSQ
jgi:hypothetical protein